jgi:hypothetical protein
LATPPGLPNPADKIFRSKLASAPRPRALKIAFWIRPSPSETMHGLLCSGSIATASAGIKKVLDALLTERDDALMVLVRGEAAARKLRGFGAESLKVSLGELAADLLCQRAVRGLESLGEAAGGRRCPGRRRTRQRRKVDLWAAPHAE